MLNEKKCIVCMLSCQHRLKDDRIYWKESLTLQKAGYTVIHIGVGTEYADYVSAEGIRLIQIARKRYFKNIFINKLFRIFSFSRDITRDILIEAKKINAAVYHFHDLQINKIARILKTLPQHPKVIYDVHESYADLIRGHSHWWLKPFNLLYAFYIEKWELKNARHYDAIIATEEYVWKKFKQNRPGKLCDIIYNYSFFPASKPDAEIPKLYDAIYSGTISKLRGIYEIVEAAYIIKQSKPLVKIIIIGDFSSYILKQQIISMINAYNLSTNILLHEAVPFEEIGAFYSNSKIGLCIFHPIKLYSNAVFIKTFEYMAFGLPVVGSNFGTVAGYIRTADAGITVNPLSPDDIAKAIIKLLDSPGLYEKYSNNGITAVREKYNWQQEASKLLMLYKKLQVCGSDFPISLSPA